MRERGVARGIYVCGCNSVGVCWEIIDLFILKDGRLRPSRGLSKQLGAPFVSYTDPISLALGVNIQDTEAGRGDVP